MDIDVFNNKILIIKDGLKDHILDLINSKKKLINVKIITLSELKKKYYFDYDNEAIYYICNKYNVISDVAKIYLNNMYYVKNIDNDKVKFLLDIKKDLEEQELLHYNPLFKKYLMSHDVILYNLKYVDKFYYNIFNELPNKEYINYEHKKSVKKLYKASNIEEEVSFVASEICKLIKQGISINNIKLANISNDYIFVINKTFKMFNIPVTLPSNSSIKGTKIVKRFKELFNSDINATIEEVEKIIKTNKDKELFKQIINILNSYSFIDDKELVKDLIFNDIDKIKVSSNKYNNAVSVINIENDIVSDEDYVFLLNYNEGVIPVNHKNEDYLSDDIKSKLGVSTSYDLNEKSILNIQNSISMTNNLVVTYSEYNLSKKLYISSSYSSDLFEECNIEKNYDNSNLYNKIRLLVNKDENNKFGTITEELVLLNSYYKNEKYMDYSNKYSLIDSKELYEFLNKELTLSYTSINSYYECAFKYYLGNILKLNKYEDSFEITVGNIFHHILSECFTPNYDISSSWEREVKDSSYVFNNMESHFLSKLKEQLILIVETIKEQLKYTQLNQSMYEKKFIVDVNKDLHITFKGFVDKILYDEVGNETVIVIIDYKTGNPSIDLNKSIYGLGMQLPVYVYLAKNSNDIKNVRIGGFYLQKILNNYKDIDELKSNLKLQGYSNSDINILELVDSSYENSNVIKSMKTTSRGFYQYAKLINDEDIDKLSNIVKDKIEEAGNKIINAKFDINPKQIKDDIIGCKYCKYKDICYMRNEDIIKLEPQTNIFGGEDND